MPHLIPSQTRQDIKRTSRRMRTWFTLMNTPQARKKILANVSLTFAMLLMLDAVVSMARQAGPRLERYKLARQQTRLHQAQAQNMKILLADQNAARQDFERASREFAEIMSGPHYNKIPQQDSLLNIMMEKCKVAFADKDVVQREYRKNSLMNLDLDMRINILTQKIHASNPLFTRAIEHTMSHFIDDCAKTK